MAFHGPEWRRFVPSLATALTLLLGLGAIEAARFGDPDLGLRFVMLAILTDGIDGVLARRMGVASDFGSHLDALADVVAFGVAPGLLFAAQHPEAPGPLRFGVIAMVALAGAFRLARFQAEPPQRDFVGMPITIGGPLLALAVAGYQPAAPTDAFAWAFVLAALMVSRVPFPRFNTGRIGRIAPFLGALFVLALAMDGHVAFMAAQAALVGYAGWGLAHGLSLAVVGERPAAGGRRRGE